MNLRSLPPLAPVLLSKAFARALGMSKNPKNNEPKSRILVHAARNYAKSVLWQAFLDGCNGLKFRLAVPFPTRKPLRPTSLC